LSVITCGIIMLFKIVEISGDKKMATPIQRVGLISFGFIVGLFLLAFFSFHFCAFHAGHASLLNGFFPLTKVDLPNASFGQSFMNPPKLLWIALSKIAPLYGWFLFAAIWIEWRKILGPVLGALRFQPEILDRKLNRSLFPKNPFFSPYVNVLRMHFLIFFFVGAHFLKLDNFFVYAVVYAVYFFPWSMLRKSKAVDENANALKT
jgi:hypothetical protein